MVTKPKAAAQERKAASTSKGKAGELAFGKVDLLKVDPKDRPMTGRDIDTFRARHKLQTVDVIYALCIQSSALYNRTLRSESIPFATELLIRLYDLRPGHAPWREVTPMDAFEILYADVLRKFKGTIYEKDARLALYRRFTACFGRSVYTAYRWLETGGNHSTKRGNSKRAILKVFAKLSTLDNPREVLEGVSRQMLKVRGIDLDATYPLPTLENPPPKKKRGPQPKNRDASGQPIKAAAPARSRATATA